MGANNSVCVIVINYFGAEKTALCLRSLIAEPLTTLLLVDNSATVAERAALTTLVSELVDSGLPFPLRPLYNQENLGFGRAINRAIAADRATTGGHDYYLLLNNDAVATPGLVAGLLGAAAVDHRLGLASPRIRWAKEDVCYYWYQPFLGHVSRKPFPGSFPYLSGCCLLVAASLIRDDRLFDENFFMYGEDIELTARVVRAGRSIMCIDSLLAIHEGTGSSSHGGLFYEYHVARGHVLLGRMLANGFRTRALFALGRAPYLVARAVIRALLYRSTLPIHALVQAWAGRDIRQSLQGRWVVGDAAHIPQSSVKPSDGKRA